jgi:hypothetical protein
MKPRSTNGRCNIHRPIKSIIRDAKTCTRRGHCCSTRVRCRISAGHAAVLGGGAEHRAGLVEANAREQQPLDVQAIPGPQFDFEEVAPIGDQRIIGSSWKGSLIGWRLAQTTSLDGLPFGWKCDRKIAMSICRLPAIRLLSSSTLRSRECRQPPIIPVKLPP